MGGGNVRSYTIGANYSANRFVQFMLYYTYSRLTKDFLPYDKNFHSVQARVQFVFITGITKFTQISLFSVLNNLTNISFYPQYAALCGITKQEITDNFMPEIEAMGQKNGWTAEETVEQLKANYDGYHFSADNMVDVFNPFSLINALEEHKLRNFWAASGATSLLPKFVDDMEIRLKDFDHCAILSNIIETSDVVGGGAELFLYQSGYLTIKGYSEGVYYLSIPNHEVRQALYEMVLPALAMRKLGDIQSTQAFLRDVLELKLTKNGGLAAAEEQIKDNRYTEPFGADKRKTIALAVELDDLGKGLIDWKEVEGA